MTTTALTGTAPEATTAPEAPATRRAVRTTERPETRIVPVGRRLAVAGLVVGAGLNTAEAVLGQLLPQQPERIVDQLAGVAEHTALYGTRAVLGTIAVPFMAVAFLAAARTLAPRARRTAMTAGALLLAGMWGFLGVHVVGLLQLPASQSADLPAAAAVLEQVQSSPVLGALFMLPFLVGTVVGMVVLTVGLLRTGAVPRWIPGIWLLFILLDFSVGAVGPVDPHWLFFAGAVGLAAHIARTDDTAWRTA